MNLPKNGKIVIIDDEPKDIIPLAQSLSLLQSSVHIFQSFDSSELPTRPLVGVRLVFLDLELDIGLGKKNQPGNARTILKKIVDRGNRPFILIVWTEEPELFNETKNLIEEDFKVHVIMMEKTKFVSKGQYDIKSIQDKITTSIENVEMINLLGEWENILHDAAIEVSSELTNIIPRDGNWNKNMSNLFKALAKARTDKQLALIDEKGIIDNALAMITATFLTKVYNGVRDTDFGDKTAEMIRVGEKIDDPETKAKINTQLLFTKKTSVNPLPGNIYESLPNSSFSSDEFIKQCMSTNITSENLGNLTMIYLIVNAMCDYAQKKWRTLRIVPGVVIPGSICKEDINNRDDLYIIPYVHFNDKISHIVFDLGSVTSCSMDSIIPTPILCLTYETLTDIQSRLASHVSRPGTVFLR